MVWRNICHKLFCLQYGRPGFHPWVRKIPWRREWQPIPVFLPGESPWTEEPGGPQSMGSQRTGHSWVTKHSTAHHKLWGIKSISVSFTLSYCSRHLAWVWKWKWKSLSCVWLCDPTDCSTPGFLVHHHLPELAQSQWCHPTISSSVAPFSSYLQSFPASGSFPMSWLFTSGGQILELQLQHQSSQWIFRTDFL